MRVPLVILTLLTLPLVLPATAAPTALLEDPTGDTQVDLGFQGSPATVPFANPQVDDADLVGLSVDEDEESLLFTLQAAGYGQALAFTQYRIHFEWNGIPYAIVAGRSILSEVRDPYYFADLVQDPEEDYTFIADLEFTVDEGAASIQIRLPKVYVLDKQDRMPLKDSVLKAVSVEARQYVAGIGFFLTAHDRMPDEGETAYTLREGDEATGHLRLVSDERVRVSNGGSTTFVFRAAVRNSGDVEDEVALTFGDLPEGYEAKTQSPVIVPPQGERVVTVLLSVPFAHDHGGHSSFLLQAASGHAPDAKASIRLGVLHTPIPQPAGHHQDLYLHAQNMNSGVFAATFPYASGWMNTESDHAGDTVEANAWGYNGQKLTFRFPLNPGLRMGVDFDLDRVGTLSGAILGRSNVEATVTAALFLVDKNEWGGWGEMGEGLLLAESDAAVTTFDLQKASPFTVKLTPTEDANYIPHAPDQNLVLEIYAEWEGLGPAFCCGTPNSPTMSVADFKLNLPLNEYHDRLDGVAEVESALGLAVVGTAEKAGRPGTLLTYTATMTNRGKTPATFNVELAGTDAEVGSLVPSGSITLEPGETRELTLGVAIPADATEGTELEVLLFAHNEADPTQNAVVRTKTTVAFGDDAMADESQVFAAAQQAENETPAGGALLAIAALASAMLLARRRG